MVRIEIKKILLKQNGLLLVLCFAIAGLLLSTLYGYSSDEAINRNPEGYAKYLQQYEGILTEDKEIQLQEEATEVNRAEAALDTLSKDFTNGTISEIEYMTACEEYTERLRNQQVFEILYSQLRYVKEDPEHRYLMDDRGWTSLLSQEHLDFALLVCLVVLIAPVFCTEYDCDMDEILLSCPKGRLRLAVCKLLLSTFFAVVLTILFHLIRFGYLAAVVGLPHGDFPLQSLEAFAASPYHFTLIQAFLVILVCRILGAVFLASIIIFTSVFCRKALLSAFASTGIVLLGFLLGTQELKYWLPTPAGLLAGIGYLWGTTYTSAYNEEWELIQVPVFRGITPHWFMFLLALFGFLTVLLATASIRLYLGKSFCLHAFRKRAGVIIASILTVCMLGGCSTSTATDSLTFDALNGSVSGETDGYNITLDVGAQKIYAKNRSTGKQILLTREPFSSEQNIHAIFVRDNICYYLDETDNETGIRIWGIDLQDFRKTLIYNGQQENQFTAFGLLSEVRSSEEEMENNSITNYFFMNDRTIYYVQNSNLFSVDRRTEKSSVLARDVREGYSLFYHDSCVYYINKAYQLCVFLPLRNRVITVDNVYTNSFQIEDDTLIYIDYLHSKQKIKSRLPF